MDYECPACGSNDGLVLGHDHDAMSARPLMKYRCRRCGDLSWWEDPLLPVASYDAADVSSTCAVSSRCGAQAPAASRFRRTATHRMLAACHKPPCSTPGHTRVFRDGAGRDEARLIR
jgi:hypothetical protein